MSGTACDDLIERIQALEAAASSLDPSEGERRRLHDAVHAVAERFLSDLATLPAFRRDDRGVLEAAITYRHFEAQLGAVLARGVAKEERHGRLTPVTT